VILGIICYNAPEMALSTQPYKGARDFYPEEKRLQKYMFKAMRDVAESFGYEEYDAPIIEPIDLYLAKSSQEIVDEQTYAFVDRGGRSVTLRPEMTPTVSRMVAGKRQELAYPLRWYSIPNLWRYERPQRGRLREHWQLNVDIFGVDNTSADIEIIQVADGILRKLGAKSSMFTIKVNSRKLINHILQEVLSLDAVQSQSMVRLIDRIEKIERSAFTAQVDALFTQAQRERGSLETLMHILDAKSLSALPQALASHPSVMELKLLMDALANLEITNAEFDIKLMRGFDYYTDIVFEVFDTNPENNRSMFGGGRYDGLVGQFGVEPLPTVGFGMGDVTLQNFLESHKLLPNLKTETDAYVILVGPVYERTAGLIAKWRRMGLNTSVDTTNRKIEKQIKTAVKKGIRYAIIIGEEELKNEQYILKDLTTGKEESHGADRIVGLAKDHRIHDPELT
jgi:histidyl-tRNA synthetase